MSPASALNFLGDRLHRLPLAIVYVTERCNSRCTTCDFWRHGTRELDLGRARELSGELRALGCEAVLLTGGEALFHSRWEAIAAAFRDAGLRIWLLTAGLSLERDRASVRELCDRVTVSVDGATRESYRAIRGVDAFERVVAGVEALVSEGAWVSIRTTLQRRNYREMPELVRLAKELGVRQISFLAVDVQSSIAFARRGDGLDRSPALGEHDLPRFRSILRDLERDFAPELERGFIAEPPEKLLSMHQYFAALCGKADPPPVRCNAPRFSAVIRASGELAPCHFIGGFQFPDTSLRKGLNHPELVTLRRQIRAGEREECQRCVCPMWKSARELVLASPFGG